MEAAVASPELEAISCALRVERETTLSAARARRE
jgi:hypothetical protein